MSRFVAPLRRLLLITTLILAIPAHGQPTPAIQDPGVVVGELGARLDDYLTRLERFGMHGAILIERRGEIVLHKGYGLAARAPERPITRDTLFHLGSLGKQFTAAAILTLQQDGKLHVQDTIDQHLGDVPADKKNITIHQLLTHSAGLPYMPGDLPALELPLESPPGEKYAYSNPGYTILAMIIVRVSGQPFNDYLAEHVLEPAGLTSTVLIGTQTWPTDDVAHAYTDDSDQGLLSTWTSNLQFAGAGDVASSVGDLYRWEDSLRNNKVLTPASTQQLFTEHVRNPGSRTGYAYGWMTTTTMRDTRLVMHPGNLGGFNSDYRRYLDEDLVMIFLSNHFMNGRSMRDAVVNNVSMLINGGDPLMPPAVRDPGHTPDLESIAGTYTFDDGADIELTQFNHQLYISAASQRTLLLIFAPDADEDLLAFIEACNERACALAAATAEGDDTVLRAEISPSLPFAGAWRSISAMVGEWKRELGPYRECRVIGTAPSGGALNGKTTIELVFEKGSRLLQVTWGRQGILHITTPPFLPARAFLAQDDSRFVAYDLFTGQTTSIRVGRDSSGRRTVAVMTPKGAVTAKRTP